MQARKTINPKEGIEPLFRKSRVVETSRPKPVGTVCILVVELTVQIAVLNCLVYKIDNVIVFQEHVEGSWIFFVRVIDGLNIWRWIEREVPILEGRLKNCQTSRSGFGCGFVAFRESTNHYFTPEPVIIKQNGVSRTLLTPRQKGVGAGCQQSWSLFVHIPFNASSVVIEEAIPFSCFG